MVKRQSEFRTRIPDFRKKIDHIIEHHPMFGLKRGRGGYEAFSKHLGISKATFSYLLTGRPNIDKPYTSGELFSDQTDKICKKLPIKEDTLLEVDFEAFKSKWAEELIAIRESNEK